MTARPPSRPLYVCVEGPIGVGKTTLVSQLSKRLAARTILEVVEENPFLASFYEDRDRYAFQTQIFFLMSRFQQQGVFAQGDLFTPSTVSDYHILKDRIFARLTLRDAELALYDKVYEGLEAQIVQPDVLIYLHAPIPVLLERIARRGRPFEADFDQDYLISLAEMYVEEFAHYTRTPLLSVDTAAIDFREDGPVDALFQRVLAACGVDSAD